MTNFNPEGGFKDIEAWGEIAEKKAGNTGAASKFIGGILIGGLGVSMGAEILGGVIAAWLFKSAWDALSNAGTRLKLVRDMGCNSFVLNGSDFKTYVQQFGEEAVRKELIHAQSQECELSNDAANWLQNYSKNINTIPALQKENVIVSQPILQTIASQLGASTYQETASTVDTYDPYFNSKIDILTEMTDRITNLFIVGLGNSGKGILISNALREIKKLYPNKKIFLINGKDELKEYGYFKGIVDIEKRLHCETAKPQTVAAWFEASIKQYDEFAANNDGALLIIDEGTIIGARLKTAKCTLLNDKLIGISSCGGSSGKNIWFLAQTPYVGANGSDKSGISQLTPIVLVNESNLSVLEVWKQASLFKKYDSDEVAELVEQSECDRAVYFGKSARWYSMPTLQNYSGYNRDKGEYLPGYFPPTDTQKPEDNLQASQEINNDSMLSKPAEEVYEWLKTNRPKQWIKYSTSDRDQVFINYCRRRGFTSTEQMIDELFSELLLVELIDIDEAENQIYVL